MSYQGMLDQRDHSLEALDRLCAKQHKAGWQLGAASGNQTPANLRALALWQARWFWYDVVADHRMGSTC